MMSRKATLETVIKNNFLIFNDINDLTLAPKDGSKVTDPLVLNITECSLSQKLHYESLLNGADLILTSTLRANPFQYEENKEDYSLAQIIKAAVTNACQAIKQAGRQAYVAYVIGPLGKEALSFEQTYDAYAKIVKIAVQEDIDVFMIDKMSDLYEAKAAVLAVKENSAKPFFVSVALTKNGTTSAGNDLHSIVVTLESLGVTVIGLSCAAKMVEVLPFIKEFIKYTSTPFMLQLTVDYRADDDLYVAAFMESLRTIMALGVNIIGLNNAPNNLLKKVAADVKTKEVIHLAPKTLTTACSGFITVIFDDNFIKIGERLNPSSNIILQEALLKDNFAPYVKEALKQEEEQADILDVNVGLSGYDEVYGLSEAVKKIQAQVKIPLQLDTVDANALAEALRIYNGKPIINSVTGTAASLNKVLPLAKQYGALLIGLCLDEKGPALSVAEKLRVAGKILSQAQAIGIKKENLIIDPLALTLYAHPQHLKASLDALPIIKKELGVKTILGISNVSFGLLAREVVNSAYLSMALYNGLDSAIINPASTEVMTAIKISTEILNKK